ncbi:MAG: hypothetical protein WEC79_08035 [Thermomicrobiales bacterium]
MPLLIVILAVIAAGVVWAERRMAGRPSVPAVHSQPVDVPHKDQIWRDLERESTAFRMRSNPGPFG